VATSEPVVLHHGREEGQCRSRRGAAVCLQRLVGRRATSTARAEERRDQVLKMGGAPPRAQSSLQIGRKLGPGIGRRKLYGHASRHQREIRKVADVCEHYPFIEVVEPQLSNGHNLAELACSAGCAGSGRDVDGHGVTR
jgi:hypothetical protein